MKKFIALALALAMMVSCLVFTASAEDNGVAVTLQGPTTVETGGTFQVKVRVTDTQNIVGGVQGVVKVTGATVAGVEVNPELNTWNKTENEKTIYKNENNVVTFASLNKLEANTYDTRVWFIIDYQVTDADAVKVELKNVKVSNKEAKAITTVATSDLAIDVITPDPSAPSLEIKSAALLVARTSDDGYEIANTANKSGIVINGSFEMANADVTEFGVIFYPTNLLDGEALTVDTKGAVIAKVDKNHGLYAAVKAGKPNFAVALKFAFNTDEQALRFLGTRVTARAYYKVGDEVVYACNSPEEDTYVKNGVADKAVLNIIIDKGPSVPEMNAEGSVTKAEFDAALNGLKTSNANWQDNRAKALKYVVDYAYSLEQQ